MKTHPLAMLVFLFVRSLWRALRSSAPHSVSDHKKTSPHWLVNPLPLAQLLLTALNFYGLTALLLSSPRLHTRFLLQVDYSNSK